MALATDYRTTGNASTEGKLDIDVSDILFHTGEPSDTPLIALTGGKLYLDGKADPKEVAPKVKKEVATEVRFDIVEKDALSRIVTVNGAVASTSEETVTFDTTTSLGAGDILKNLNTGEVLMVITKTSATSYECKRNLGSTSYQIYDDDTMYISSFAHKQGGSKRGLFSQIGAARSRYTQIFKRSFGVTDTLMNILLKTAKDDWDEEMTQGAVNHKLDIESAFWYGPAVDSTTDADGNTVYLTRGIVAELGTTRTIDCNGALDEDKFFGAMAEEAFKYGPSRKALFADAKMVTRINGFSRVKQQTEPKMTDYGVSVKTIETGHGIIDVMRCGLFNKHQLASDQGFGVILDLDNVVYKYIKNRDSKYMVDIQTPGDDVREGQFITEAGLSLRLLDHHRIISNIG